MRRAVLYFSVFLILIFLGCARKEAAIKLAVVGPLSGRQAMVSQDVLHGVELAVEEWNKKGGVLGRKVSIIQGDDEGIPSKAFSVAKKLAKSGIVAVIGHLNSDCSIAASPIYHQYKIPQVSPVSTNPQFTEQGFETTFRTCGRDDQQGLVCAKFVTNDLKVSRILVLHDKTTYGKGLAEELMRNLGPYVGVVDYQGIDKGVGFKDILAKALTLRPEAIYYGGMYPDGAVLAKEIREVGLKCALIGGDGLFHPEFIKNGGGATEGAFVSFGPPLELIPSAHQFLEAFKKKYGEVGPYSVYAYDAANVLLETIVRTGSIKGEKLLEFLHSQTYQGALGKIQFDHKGDVLSAPYVIWMIKNGKFVLYP